LFQSKTVFVIGAGASAEIGFPTGTALIETIKRKLTYDTGAASLSDQQIHHALLTHLLLPPLDATPIPSLSDYLQAARRITRAMPLSASIDTFTDDHQKNACI
jgi:hypothetical protein